MNNMTKITIGAVIVALLAFWGGDQYGKGQTAAVGAASQNRTGQFGGADGRGARGAGLNSLSAESTGQRGGFVAGDIIAKDSQSITIKMQNGSTKIVLYSANTPVQKTVAGSDTDLSVGTAVVVTGNANSDGSLSANAIQIRSNVSIQPRAQSLEKLNTGN